MKSANILVLIISVLTFSVWSCKSKQVVVEEAVEEVVDAEEAIDAKVVQDDDGCNYILVEGTGKIVSLNLSNMDNVVIKFDFTPTTKGKSTQPETSNKKQLFNVKGVGKYPPFKWCKENGIAQDSTFKVNKYELVGNSDFAKCEKVKFSFVDFENKGW